MEGLWSASQPRVPVQGMAAAVPYNPRKFALMVVGSECENPKAEISHQQPTM